MAFDVVRYVQQKLQEKYRVADFAVPISIREAPIAAQMPGLVEPPRPVDPLPIPMGLGGLGSLGVGAPGSGTPGSGLLNNLSPEALQGPGAAGVGESPLGGMLALLGGSGGSPEALQGGGLAPSGAQSQSEAPPSPSQLEAQARQRMKDNEEPMASPASMLL